MLRTLLAVVFIAATALAFLLLSNRRRTMLGFLIVFAVLVALFFQIPASNDRAWQSEVALTPHATIRGDLVTIHNLRNFDYRTETDFDIRLENRTYDLRKLDSVDLITVYWESKAISFGFQGKDYLAVSIETRKEKGESYSTLAGFFRQYAIYYVGDKCACAHLSPTSRGRLYYRVKGPLGNLRRVFVDYIEAMNDLRERPQFYNTLTTNCTTSVWLHTRMNPESPPLSWKMLLSGYVPDYLYELGRLDTSRPFDELEKYRTSTHAPKLPIKTRRREQ